MTENQKQDFEDRRRKTAEVREYLLACNVKLVEIYECEWYRLVQDDPEAARISRLGRYTDYKKLQGSGVNGQVEEADILKAVLNNTFFGLVECDIHVPDSLRQSKFAEFPPIFKNTLVDRSHISPLMREYAEKHDALKKPTRMLISSFSGEKVVLTTPLLKWYLENGLKVTKIYQITHYEPQACFTSFETEVTEARRLGDVDPTKAVIGNAMKLLGNSSYGKTITRVENHMHVAYLNLKDLEEALKQPTYHRCIEINDNLFEVHSYKKQVEYKLPVQIGFFVYAYAKLRMLEFVFECLDKFIPRSCYQLMEMDTDSMKFSCQGHGITYSFERKTDLVTSRG